MLKALAILSDTTVRRSAVDPEALLKLYWKSEERPHFSVSSTILLFTFLKKIGIHSMQGSTATKRHGVTRKRSAKGLQHTENLFRKNLKIKDVC